MDSTLNFAQKTNFIAGSPQFPNMEFYLQTVDLPGITLELATTKTFNLTHNMPADSHSYDGLSFTALLDEDFKLYDLFFNELLGSKSLVNGTFAQREFDFYIQVYNNKGNLLFTEFFRNCLLESIGNISLATNDDSITNTINVGLKFDWLEIKKEGLSEQERKDWNIYPPKKNECECKVKVARSKG